MAPTAERGAMTAPRSPSRWARLPDWRPLARLVQRDVWLVARMTTGAAFLSFRLRAARRPR
jgi:hypothetical protein